MKLYILKELIRRGGMSISICHLMGQKNIHPFHKRRQFAKGTKKLSTNFKGEGG
jgi:hypothetical protein